MPLRWKGLCSPSYPAALLCAFAPWLTSTFTLLFGIPLCDRFAAHVDGGGGASCNQCGFCAVDGQSTDEAGKGPPEDSTTVVNPSCCGDETTKRRSPAESPPDDYAIINRRRCEESLREARRDFEGGMEAYMREDSEVLGSEHLIWLPVTAIVVKPGACCTLPATLGEAGEPRIARQGIRVEGQWGAKDLDLLASACRNNCHVHYLLVSRKDAAASAISVWFSLLGQDALVTLERSLLVRERILHPFNKELLRTLR